MSDRARAAADALRHLAPDHECCGIWGRAAPSDTRATDTVWMAEPAEVAALVIEAADEADAAAGVHRVEIGSPASTLRFLHACLGEAVAPLTGAIRGFASGRVARPAEPHLATGSKHDQWCLDVRHMARLSEAILARPDHDPQLGAVDQVLALLDRGDKALIELDEVGAAHEHLSRQIGQLSTYIMEEIPGEPSQDEGAVECAIRLLRRWRQDSVTLNCFLHQVAQALGETDEATSVVANPAKLVGRLVDRIASTWVKGTWVKGTDTAETRRIGSGGQVRAHDDWCPDVRYMARLSAALLAHRDHDPEQGTVDQALALLARGDSDREQLRLLLDWLLRNQPGPEVDRAADGPAEQR